jgi:hypothetical protein
MIDALELHAVIDIEVRSSSSGFMAFLPRYSGFYWKFEAEIKFSFSFFQNGLHATHIHLIYEHNNKDVILDLHLNDNLIPIEHFISYQEPNGDKAIKNFTKTEIDLCNYQVSIQTSFRL